MITGICSEPFVLEIMRIVNIVISLLKIIVPLILIVIIMINVGKGITDGEEELNKAIKGSVSKFIAALLIFFVPTIVVAIFNLTLPNSEFLDCLNVKTKEDINNVYVNKEEEYVKKAEETLSVKDYESAKGLLNRIKNEDKKKEYVGRLEIVKEKIDEFNKPVYARVNYSNFKWTYYSRKEGPIYKYYPSDNTKYSAYTIWAPDNISDLNGVKIPLIIWLHGAGETTSKLNSTYFLKNGTIQKLLANWGNNLNPVPAIVIASHASGSFAYNENYESTIYAAINYAISELNVDPNKVILMGHSMGADDTIAIGYQMYKKYSKEYFSSFVSISPSSYIANKQYGSYNSNSVIDFYKTRKAKGYSENSNCKSWYDWTGKELIYLNGVSHNETTKEAFIQDKNNNRISDLVEWMFYS